VLGLPCFFEMSPVSQGAIKCHTKINRVLFMFYSLIIEEDIQLSSSAAIMEMENAEHGLAYLGCSRQRLQYSAIRAISAVRVHSSSGKVLAWVPRQISSANMNRWLCVAGRSFVYRSNNVGAKTDP